MDDTPAQQSTLINADWSKRYRKKKIDTDPDFRPKEKGRIGAIRKKAKENDSETVKEAKRLKEREWKRRYREKLRKAIKETDHVHDDHQEMRSPYRTNQTYGKAVRRCLRSLPSSPMKQKAVVCGLAKRVGIRLQLNMEREMSPRMAQQHEVVSCIRQFYFRPDIIYTVPDMKGEMTIWVNGVKSKERKHYMTMFLREAYAIFKVVHPEVHVGFSKFCECRPQNVLLLHDSPRDQCRCKIHENLILRLKGLRIQYQSDTFCPLVLCDPTPNSSCWRQKCTDCSGGKKFTMDIEPETNITWREWEKTADKGLRYVINEGCAAELLESIRDDMDKTVSHVYTKRVQAEDFEDDKECGVRVLQMNFAMNYACEYQNEVQSALWSRESVMLFTAAVILNGQVDTYIICSDSNDKGKHTVLAYIDHLYDHILKEGPEADGEVIWTDGPSSEFKNK